MKRLIMALFVALAMFAYSSFSGSAQGVTGGLEGGLNIADIYGDDAEDWNSRMAFCAGAFLTLSLVDMFAIQPEVLYARKGTRWEEEYAGETYTATLTLDYLEIPLLAKLSMPLAGIVKPNLFFGPGLGILLSAKVKGEGVETDIKDDTKSTDFGFVVGAGLDFDLAMSKVTLSGRYTLGLTSIDDSEVDPQQDVKNGVISAMVGYSF